MNRTLLVAVLIVWTVVGLAQGAAAKSMSAVPPEVKSSIKEKREACEPAHEEIEPGFITRQDVNGDHVDDYILDYGKFICGVDQSFFCGTEGCLTEVFVSLPDGFQTGSKRERPRNSICADKRPTRHDPRPAWQLLWKGRRGAM